MIITESEINKEIKKKDQTFCQSNNWWGYISLKGGKKGGQELLEWRETKRLCMKTKLKIVGFLFLFPGDFWPFGIYYVMKLSYLRLRKGLFQLSLFKLLRF